MFANPDLRQYGHNWSQALLRDRSVDTDDDGHVTFRSSSVPRISAGDALKHRYMKAARKPGTTSAGTTAGSSSGVKRRASGSRSDVEPEVPVEAPKVSARVGGLSRGRKLLVTQQWRRWRVAQPDRAASLSRLHRPEACIVLKQHALS